MKGKLWSNEGKVAVVLEIVRSDESAAAICTRYGVSATQAYQWLDRFLEGGRSALSYMKARAGEHPEAYGTPKGKGKPHFLMWDSRR